MICFYKQVPDILHRIRDAGVTVAAVSRTCAPNLCVLFDLSFLNISLTSLPSARQALSLLLVPPKRGDADGKVLKAESFFDEMEIYPGRSSAHRAGLILISARV